MILAILIKFMHTLPCEEFGAAVSARGGREGEEKRKMGHSGRGTEASLGNLLLSCCGHSNSAPSIPIQRSWEPNISLAFVILSKAGNKQVSGHAALTRHRSDDILPPISIHSA